MNFITLNRKYNRQAQDAQNCPRDIDNRDIMTKYGQKSIFSLQCYYPKVK